MSFVMDVLRPRIPPRPKSPCAGNGKVASIADQIFRSSERSERFPTILFLYSLGKCRQSSSGLGLFVKEAVWMPQFVVTKVRCSFEVMKMLWAIIRNILIECCNYMEGIYSPAKGHVKAGKGHIINTRYGVVVVMSIFLSVYLLTQ